MRKKIQLRLDGKEVSFKSLRILHTNTALSSAASAVLASSFEELEHASFEVEHADYGLIFKGRIDSFERSFGSEGLQVQVEARDGLGALVDSSLEKSREFRGDVPLSLVLDHLLKAERGHDFEVKNGIQQPAAVVTDFRVEAGDLIGRSIEAAASQANILPVSNRLGSLVAFKEGPLFANLKEGVNVFSARFKRDLSNEFSRTTFTWQRSYIGPENEPLVRENRQSRIHRPRYKVIPFGTSPEAARNRLDWEVAVNKIKSNLLETDVFGWGSEGLAWQLGQRFSVTLPSLGITEEFILSGVDFVLDVNRIESRLKLSLPGAFAGPPTEKKRNFVREFGFPGA